MTVLRQQSAPVCPPFIHEGFGLRERMEWFWIFLLFNDTCLFYWLHEFNCQDAFCVPGYLWALLLPFVLMMGLVIVQYSAPDSYVACVSISSVEVLDDSPSISSIVLERSLARSSILGMVWRRLRRWALLLLWNRGLHQQLELQASSWRAGPIFIFFCVVTIDARYLWLQNKTSACNYCI